MSTWSDIDIRPPKPYEGTINKSDQTYRNIYFGKWRKNVQARKKPTTRPPQTTQLSPPQEKTYVPVHERRVQQNMTLTGPAPKVTPPPSPEKGYEPLTAKRPIENKIIRLAAVAKAAVLATSRPKGVEFEPTSAQRRVENKTLQGPKPETPLSYFPYYRTSPENARLTSFEPVIFPSYVTSNPSPYRSEAPYPQPYVQTYRQIHEPFYPAMVPVESKTMNQSEATARRILSMHLSSMVAAYPLRTDRTRDLNGL